MFAGTDANYSFGSSFALTRNGKGLIGGIWDLFGVQPGSRTANYELGQAFFTPTQIHRPVPDPQDRPYAGLLYLATSSHLRNGDNLKSIKLLVGAVGPCALARDVQRLTHKVVRDSIPEGWKYQLDNEPVINLFHEYRHRFNLAPPESLLDMDLIPLAGWALGNFMIRAQAETQLRIGYNLPDDFGPSLLLGVNNLPVPVDQADKNWGFYLFVGGGGSLVARNLTLDGNTFRSGPSVAKKIFVPSVDFGFSLWTKPAQLTFSFVMLGKEFHGQQKSENFGAVTLAFFH
jgi:hypothetical protein